MIAVDDITFQYSTLYGSGRVVDIVYEYVDIRYVVIEGDNEVDGELSMGFDVYEHMKHSELIDEIRK